MLKSLVDNLFLSLSKRKISEVKTRELLVSIKIVEASGRYGVVYHLQQHTTAIMHFALQNGLIDYNPAQDMAGAVAVAKRVHRQGLIKNVFPNSLIASNALKVESLLNWQ